jgi:hypothetical protein
MRKYFLRAFEIFKFSTVGYLQILRTFLSCWQPRASTLFLLWNLGTSLRSFSWNFAHRPKWRPESFVAKSLQKNLGNLRDFPSDAQLQAEAYIYI